MITKWETFSPKKSFHEYIIYILGLVVDWAFWVMILALTSPCSDTVFKIKVLPSYLNDSSPVKENDCKTGKYVVKLQSHFLDEVPSLNP